MQLTKSLFLYWLSSAKLSYQKAKILIEDADGIESIFTDPFSLQNKKLRIQKNTISYLASRANIDLLESELSQMKKIGIFITTLYSADYPPLLKETACPPLVLYGKGELSKLPKNLLAIVGSRNASSAGMSNVKSIAAELSQCGIGIVSGLARGIDTAAAAGSLAGGAPPVAVLGSGINVIYPKENAALYHEICEKGVVLSEYPPNTPPLAQNFPIRNRIISGMCPALLIAEGTMKSGGAITVRLAVEENREVFALPGDINKPGSILPNTLISEGAHIVLSAESILEEMGWKNNLCEIHKNFQQPTLDLCSNPLYTLLMQGECSLDYLSEATGIPISKINLNLTELELNGLIERMPGNIFRIK